MGKSELFNNDSEGMKISVHEVRNLSRKGKQNLPRHLKKRTKKTFIPLQTVFMPFSEANTPDKIAHFIYKLFGASPEGKTYRILYFRKVGKWSRRFAKLCWIKIWDTEIGEYNYQILNYGNLSRFSWFRK